MIGQLTSCESVSVTPLNLNCSWAGLNVGMRIRRVGEIWVKSISSAVGFLSQSPPLHNTLSSSLDLILKQHGTQEGGELRRREGRSLQSEVGKPRWEKEKDGDVCELGYRVLPVQIHHEHTVPVLCALQLLLLAFSFPPT